jgi:hypothetical protein
LKEIGRVLKPGGRCLASFYLLNADARRGIAAGMSAFTFSHRRDHCYVDRADAPDLAVAPEESQIRAILEASGLAIDRVWHGGWPSTRRQDQDLLLLRRRGDETRPLPFANGTNGAI